MKEWLYWNALFKFILPCGSSRLWFC